MRFGTMIRPLAANFDAIQLFASPLGYGERAKVLMLATWQKKKLSETRYYKKKKAFKWLNKLALKLNEYYAHYFNSYHEIRRFNLNPEGTNMGSVTSRSDDPMMNVFSEPPSIADSS